MKSCKHNILREQASLAKTKPCPEGVQSQEMRRATLRRHTAIYNQGWTKAAIKISASRNKAEKKRQDSDILRGFYLQRDLVLVCLFVTRIIRFYETWSKGGARKLCNFQILGFYINVIFL